jgi:HNH endonuclease/AP2 domain
MRVKKCPSADYLRAILDYSPLTGLFVWRWRHDLSDIANKVCAGKGAGSTSTGGYQVIGINGKMHMAHRLAWVYMTGEEPIGEIDHINLNRSCNIFSNLRLASRSQNHANTRAKINNSTGFKGVVPFKETGRFRGAIKFHGKTIWLGAFDTPEEAHEAYRDAAEIVFGVFARTT